ncbi:hypothetical protein BpHYR1_043759 [Brachionus plicatilis]|uniref:Uncharacterized protein n=1 Tax=Brachionus plicatilis TaxID=10195 RepID=A0A3M7Q0P7_BRAPC|nr:hypothetical protein BpHYR1_043759 [Brachionus plicatilis]
MLYECSIFDFGQKNLLPIVKPRFHNVLSRMIDKQKIDFKSQSNICQRFTERKTQIQIESAHATLIFINKMDSSLSNSSCSSTKEYSLPESLKMEMNLQIYNEKKCDKKEKKLKDPDPRALNVSEKSRLGPIELEETNTKTENGQILMSR